MGDRTWVRLICHVRDRAAFEAATDMAPVFDEPPPKRRSKKKKPKKRAAPLHVELYDDEMCSLLENLPQGKPYIQEFGPGIEFGAGEVVSDGFEVSEMECGFHRGSYVINWSNRDNALEELERHMRIRERALEKLGLKELP